jgi:hypothetical protein
MKKVTTSEELEQTLLLHQSGELDAEAQAYVAKQIAADSDLAQMDELNRAIMDHSREATVCSDLSPLQQETILRAGERAHQRQQRPGISKALWAAAAAMLVLTAVGIIAPQLNGPKETFSSTTPDASQLDDIVDVAFADLDSQLDTFEAELSQLEAQLTDPYALFESNGSDSDLESLADELFALEESQI